MPARFNPPPGWRTPGAGWAPAQDWAPDAHWPPAPDGWQFWVDDGQEINLFAKPTHEPRWQPTAQHEDASPQVRWPTWVGCIALAIVVAIGAIAGGISTGALVLAAGLGAVGVTTLIRGRVTWARLTSRKAGGFVTGTAVVALLVGLATVPRQGPADPSVGLGSAPTVTTPGTTMSPTDSAGAADSAGVAGAAGIAATATQAPPPTLVKTLAQAKPSGQATTATEPTISNPAKANEPTPTPPTITETATPTNTTLTGLVVGDLCSPEGAEGTSTQGKLVKCVSNNDKPARWKKVK